MSEVTKPIALDETFNTTESTPRNLADVLASGLANIANNVKPDGSDISIDVPGMDAENVNDGFSELKQSLDVYNISNVVRVDHQINLSQKRLIIKLFDEYTSSNNNHGFMLDVNGSTSKINFIEINNGSNTQLFSK